MESACGMVRPWRLIRLNCFVTWSGWKRTSGTGWTAEFTASTVCRWRGWRSCRWSVRRRAVESWMSPNALLITVGGASKVVDKVQGAGWCRRLPNPTDGRSSLLELTESGEGLLEAANVDFRGCP